MAAGEPIIRPKCSTHLDYECELTIVVGKGGRRIPESKALEHVFGYTIFNDVSVRDFQRKTSQWTPGKNFDGAGPLGPVVVTADELAARRVRTEHHDARQRRDDADSNTSDMIFTSAKHRRHLSEFMTLEPGDLIATGDGVGRGPFKKAAGLDEGR